MVVLWWSYGGGGGSHTSFDGRGFEGDELAERLEQQVPREREKEREKERDRERERMFLCLCLCLCLCERETLCVCKREWAISDLQSANHHQHSEGCDDAAARGRSLQGYLAHKKHPPPRTLRKDYA